MPPLPTRLDPEGYYERLGLQPTAQPAEIVAAFRGKARVLHPDVPGTGNAAAFVAMKQAYDLLSNPARRETYDREARQAAQDDRAPPEIVVVRPSIFDNPPPTRHPRFSDMPIAVYAGFAIVLCIGMYEVIAHLTASPRVASSGIRPNAATVQPLTASQQQAMLYGPAPVKLAGTPNFYVIPAGTPAVLWKQDSKQTPTEPLAQLPPFSAVQAVRLIRQVGMLEVMIDDKRTGLIAADHLTPGNAVAAYQAYCGYNAGPPPFDGEVLDRRGSGPGALTLRNKSVQPAVVKLRDQTGAAVLSVFLGPGGQATLNGLPSGDFRPEYAIGELWSRACNAFAAGMRARRMDITLRLPGQSDLAVAPEADRAADIPDQAFSKN
jgi:hypothetical protein